MRLRSAAVISLVSLTAGIVLIGYANAQQPEIGAGIDSDVIHYFSNDDLKDGITQLQHDLDSGKVKLDYEPEHGYLISVLKALNVPVNSQTLVWSKTSSQADHTSPSSPRALYFNDHIYVGWAKDDPLLDVLAMDPAKGPIFFTLAQKATDKPKFVRDDSCLNCHSSNKSLGVPGLIIRSVFATPEGRARAQLNTFVAGHNNPLSQRWGGWYVTGTHGKDTHMGNAFLFGQDQNHLDLEPTSNVTDLSSRFDTSKFLAPTSDTVALMVLDDAVRMENMITRAKFETMHALRDRPMPNEPKGSRQQRIEQVAEPLVMYLFFRDEAPLHGPIKGTNDFETSFEKLGPFDKKGRSLRQFDLNTRLFKYPCNYHIYSSAWDGMPNELKDVVYRRMDEVLTGKDQTRFYKNFAADDRKNVLEILLDTKPEFKAWMQAHDSANAS